jgi:hypothetical protein
MDPFFETRPAAPLQETDPIRNNPPKKPEISQIPDLTRPAGRPDQWTTLIHRINRTFKFGPSKSNKIIMLARWRQDGRDSLTFQAEASVFR